MSTTSESMKDLLPHEQVQRFGYEKVGELATTRRQDYGPDLAVAVSLLQCPRCGALVADELVGGGTFTHMYWHEPSWEESR